MREQDILQSVVDSRSKAINTTTSNSTATEVDEAQGELTENLNRLMVLSEAYPELKSNQNWIDLQNQVEGTENRINVARKDYNEVAQTYNNKIVKFPTNLFANTFGFEKADYFKSDEGSSQAPDITFDNPSSDGNEG